MSNQSYFNPKHLVALCALFTLTGAGAQAAVLDLGTSGSGSLGGAFFSTTDVQPTGTGVFDPFLTIQNSPWEQGYNSGSDQNFDTKRVPQWNHEIQFSQLRATTINGTDYFGFVVDVNEPNGSKAGISLDGLKIFTSSTLQSNTSTNSQGFFNGSLGTLVFDLGGNTLKYTDAQHGSGSGDINIFIPVSDFAGTSANDYVYMYQRWGNTDTTQGGYEETALLSGFVPIPELGTLFPVVGLMAAVLSTHALRRRKMKELAATQISSQ